VRLGAGIAQAINHDFLHRRVNVVVEEAVATNLAVSFDAACLSTKRPRLYA